MGKRVVTPDQVNLADILSGQELDVRGSVSPEAAAALGGAVEPEELQGEAPEPAAAEPVKAEAEAPAAAAAPEASAQEDEDEPEVAPEEDDQAWLTEDADQLRMRVQRLQKSVKGQGHALSRRSGKIKRLEEQLRSESEDRRAAVRVALEARDELKAFAAKHAPQQSGSHPAPAGAMPASGEPMLELEVGDDGKIRVPASKLAGLIEQQQQPARDEATQQRQQLEAAGQYADRLLADAKVSKDTQDKLVGAIREMSDMFVAAVKRTGAQPIGNQGEWQFLREQGIERTLQQKYPGVRLEDLYDLIEYRLDPWRHGHNTVRIAKQYEATWAKPAPGGSPKPEKPRVPEHPGSLGRSGGADKHTDSTLDEWAKVSLADVVNGKFTAKHTQDLEERWRREMASGR